MFHTTTITSNFDFELSENSTFGTAEELIKESLEEAEIVSMSVEGVTGIKSYSKRYSVQVRHKIDIKTDFTFG